MTQSYKEAKEFIDKVIYNNFSRYNYIMGKLEANIEDWKCEKNILSMTNIFEMTDDETQRYNKVSSLIEYAKTVLMRHQVNKLRTKNKKLRA
jgi:hypothetical protein